MNSFEHAAGLIQHWGRERQITTNGTTAGQAKKTIEEAGEIIDAVELVRHTRLAMLEAKKSTFAQARSDAEREYDEAVKDLEDALGDTGVAWLMACACAGRDPVDMLYVGYNAIRDRRGYMNAEGIFVKTDAASVSVERDEDGMWWHPAIPWDRMPEEADARPFLRVLGYKAAPVYMRSDAPDEIINRYDKLGEPNCAEWDPSRPEGAGWFLGAICDSEEGPLALWIRPDVET